MVKIKENEREPFREALRKAVVLQVQLYDALNEVEEITGLVTGLDDCVREEASYWTKPEQVKIDAATVKSVLQRIKKEA